jgi:hypothetical protein
MFLERLVRDFAEGMKRVDARRPTAVNQRSGATFQPGIGPHSESKTVALVLDELRLIDPALYHSVRTDVAYPSLQRQRCDLVFDIDDGPWLVEAKMMRLMGDNAKPNDNILTHILSPYPAHRSALTDCKKLLTSGFMGRFAVLIYGYEYNDWPLAPVMDAFECLARREVGLSGRFCAGFEGLVHPVHQRGEVFAWEVTAR